jgi:hypothetical protein
MISSAVSSGVLGKYHSASRSANERLRAPGGAALTDLFTAVALPGLRVIARLHWGVDLQLTLHWRVAP